MIPLWPHAIEAAYRRRLLARVEAARDFITAELLQALTRLAPEIEGRADALASSDDTDRLAVALAEVRDRRTDADGTTPLEQILRVVDRGSKAWVLGSPTGAGLGTTGAQVAMFAGKQTDRMVGPVMGIQAVKVTQQLPAATKAVATWAKENGALIKTIDQRYFDDIAKVISESVDKGTQTKVIAERLQERYQVSRSRADLIARDQIAKLNSQITQIKQEKLGITKYTWSTSHDERVRAEHRVLDGQVFEWEKPPVIDRSGGRGHPGQAVQCRCVSLPYFSDDAAEVPFAPPTLSKEKPTFYGSRENPGSAALPRGAPKPPPPPPKPPPAAPRPSVVIVPPISFSEITATNEIGFAHASARATKTLTPAEIDAARRYSTEESYKTNAALRAGKMKDPALVRDLDAAIAKATVPEDVNAYRGMTAGFDVSKLKVGEAFIDDAYLSTSVLRSNALQFMGAGSDRTIIKIGVPKGSKGLYMPAVSEFSSEMELILPRGQKLIIDSITSAGPPTDRIWVVKAHVA